MDPAFIATPSEAGILAALSLWPELAGRRIRPLLVTAFGDSYVETDTGEVWVANPIELECSRVTSSVQELQQFFSNTVWAEEHLITDLALFDSVCGNFTASSGQGSPFYSFGIMIIKFAVIAFSALQFYYQLNAIKQATKQYKIQAWQYL